MENGNNESAAASAENKNSVAECGGKLSARDVAFATRRTLFGVVAFISCILAGLAGVLGLVLLLLCAVGYCGGDYRLAMLGVPGLILLGAALLLLLYAALLSPADSLLKVLRLSVVKEESRD